MKHFYSMDIVFNKNIEDDFMELEQIMGSKIWRYSEIFTTNGLYWKVIGFEVDTNVITKTKMKVYKILNSFYEKYLQIYLNIEVFHLLNLRLMISLFSM